MRYISLILCAASIARAAAGSQLTENGNAQAEIVYASKSLDFGECVYGGAERPKKNDVLAALLADYIKRISGASTPVSADRPATDLKTKIHIGKTEYVKTKSIDVSGIDEDGVVIQFPDPDNIVILARQQHGQEWAVYDFLERFLGVRWLYPGKDGVHTPENPTITLSPKDVRENPVFLHRSVSFDNTLKENAEWLRMLRLRRRGIFTHNIGVLINAKKYQETHPEYYPVQNGQRLRPLSLVGWQPCFTSPGMAKNAAADVVRFFRANPGRNTYPISINDNGGHCECADCMALDGARKNFLGCDDRSPSYYRFCNELAEEIRRLMPDKQFKLTVLAYDNVIQAPDGIKLDSSILPIVCYDLMTWIDPARQAVIKKFMDDWSASAKEFGLYDYIYGDHYYIPRVYPHVMSEYLRYAASKGAAYYQSEGYFSGFREGPKFYVTMKLLWNPGLDSDALMAEWFRLFAGEAAAAPLREYFSNWEKYWMERAPSTEWWKRRGAHTYLDFADPGYSAIVNGSELDAQGALLEKALSLAQSDIQKKRIQTLLNDFGVMKMISNWNNQTENLNRPGKKFEETENPLIYESAFKSVQDTWGDWKSDYSFTKFEWDATRGRNGDGAMLIDKSGDTRLSAPTSACFLREFPVKAGETVKIEMWTRTSGLSEKGKPGFTVRWRGASGWFHFMSLWRTVKAEPVTDGAWSKLECVLPVPDSPDVKQLSLQPSIYDSNSGKAWFDDVRVTRVRETGK
jgi:hypothetical protein